MADYAQPFVSDEQIDLLFDFIKESPSVCWKLKEEQVSILNSVEGGSFKSKYQWGKVLENLKHRVTQKAKTGCSGKSRSYAQKKMAHLLQEVESLGTSHLTPTLNGQQQKCVTGYFKKNTQSFVIDEQIDLLIDFIKKDPLGSWKLNSGQVKILNLTIGGSVKTKCQWEKLLDNLKNRVTHKTKKGSDTFRTYAQKKMANFLQEIEIIGRCTSIQEDSGHAEDEILESCIVEASDTVKNVSTKKQIEVSPNPGGMKIPLELLRATPAREEYPIVTPKQEDKECVKEEFISYEIDVSGPAIKENSSPTCELSSHELYQHSQDDNGNVDTILTKLKTSTTAEREKLSQIPLKFTGMPIVGTQVSPGRTLPFISDRKSSHAQRRVHAPKKSEKHAARLRQQELLIEYAKGLPKQNQKLSRGLISQSAATNNGLWSDITKVLNRIKGGYLMSERQWKKMYLKMEHKIKLKLRRESEGKPEAFTFLERRLAAFIRRETMNKECVEISRTDTECQLSYQSADLVSFKSEIVDQSYPLPKMTPVTSEQQKLVCRACGDVGVVNIFGTYDDSRSVEDDMRSCCALKVNLHDGLPAYLCISCVDLLRGAVRLREMCLASERTLSERAAKQDECPVITCDKSEDFDIASSADDAEGETDVDEYHVGVEQGPADWWNAYSEHYCEYCSQPVYTKEELSSHAVRCPPRPRPPRTRPPPDTAPARKQHASLCEMCGKRFFNLQNLNRHHAGHFDVFPYECALCPYRSKNGDLLKSHTRCVHSEKRHMCSECGKKFSNTGNLKAHVLTRHTSQQIKKVQCPLCDNTLGNRLSLQDHLKNFHATKPFVCNICGQQYKGPKHLAQHRRKLHKIRPRNRAVYLRCQTEDDAVRTISEQIPYQL